MNDKYIIGIDGGTQSSKVVIFNTRGEKICQASEKLKPLYMPAFGVAEHPDDDLWTSIIIASKKCMAKFPYDRADIIGAGVCTIRCCGVVLNKDGNLAQPAMNWMDKRLSAKYDHANKDARYITTTTGYTCYRLTGNHYDTAANLTGPWWPIDKDNWNWFEDKEKFDSFGVKREMLFDLVNPGDTVGTITKEVAELTDIPEGLPVVITANDKAVEGLGAGLNKSNIGLISLGTYICPMILGEGNRTDLKGAFTNMACIPHKYLYESKGIRRGMSTVSWIKDLAGDGLVAEAEELGIAPEELLNREASKIPAGTYGLFTILEWLGKPNEIYKRGIMIGFEGRHERSSMYRSILEGIAMTCKNHMSITLDDLGRKIDTLIISGGGSNSDLFMQIFADVFGIKAVRNEENGAASMGSAISVAVGLGVYKTYDEAIEKMVRITDSFEPDLETHEFYTKINKEVYSQITKVTDPILKKSYEIFH
ncbi:MAG: FGGY-family carbohydrate kinase [Pleomorphochaeta sp.]